QDLLGLHPHDAHSPTHRRGEAQLRVGGPGDGGQLFRQELELSGPVQLGFRLQPVLQGRVPRPAFVLPDGVRSGGDVVRLHGLLAVGRKGITRRLVAVVPKHGWGLFGKVGGGPARSANSLRLRWAPSYSTVAAGRFYPIRGGQGTVAPGPGSAAGSLGVDGKSTGVRAVALRGNLCARLG